MIWVVKRSPFHKWGKSKLIIEVRTHSNPPLLICFIREPSRPGSVPAVFLLSPARKTGPLLPCNFPQYSPHLWRRTLLCRPHICSCIQSPSRILHSNSGLGCCLTHAYHPQMLTGCLTQWVPPNSNGPWPNMNDSRLHSLPVGKKPWNKNILCSGSWKLMGSSRWSF